MAERPFHSGGLKIILAEQRIGMTAKSSS